MRIFDSRNTTVSILAATGLLVAIWTLQGSAAAQKAEVPHPQDKLVLGESEIKQLLILVSDKDGRITKEEWVKVVEAEFDKLDKKKSGELDVKQLVDWKPRTRPPSSAELK